MFGRGVPIYMAAHTVAAYVTPVHMTPMGKQHS
jgi:hypothetical protein